MLMLCELYSTVHLCMLSLAFVIFQLLIHPQISGPCSAEFIMFLECEADLDMSSGKCFITLNSSNVTWPFKKFNLFMS